MSEKILGEGRDDDEEGRGFDCGDGMDAKERTERGVKAKCTDGQRRHRDGEKKRPLSLVGGGSEATSVIMPDVREMSLLP